MLVDRPCELIIELPRNVAKHRSEESNDDWNSNQVRLDNWPEQLAFKQVTWACLAVKRPHSFMDLVDLNGRIDEEPEIVKTQSNDLNGVFQAQRVVHENKLINETKDEECEVCRDNLGFSNRR